MAVSRRIRAREAQLAFESISIEGGLLSPASLAKVAQLTAGMQAEADYGVPKGLHLRDEIGRYWRVAQAHWLEFAAGRDAGGNPTALAERFVVALLREGFGFSSLGAVTPTVVAGRSYPIGHAALVGRVPVVVAPAGSGVDTSAAAFGDAGRRRTAFGLGQEYLNAHEGAQWGIVCDGLTLRILRDNASLTRPAWIEADLARIFGEGRYADFAALWLLAHETRFGRDGLAASACALEQWREGGLQDGTRAREHLRAGVEDALLALGQGFLDAPANEALRDALRSGTLTREDYKSQLLRVVYRLIFLLTVEERGLLHPDGTPEAVKSLYAEGYGLRRLRERSVKRSAHDRFSDLWDAMAIVLRGVAGGEARLGLPALAGLFAPNQCPDLDAARLENRALLLAVFKLAWLRADGALVRVNWRDMGPEELGSVYESLLELVPQITEDARRFGFASGGETKGNARKTTGSYYTPDSLVQVLLDSALEPVVADTIAAHPASPVEALLQLSIVDPACGSGHFLLAAARRLAAHVARLQVNGTPSAAEYRRALRQVVGRCIYGVDINPMAVELCKVSLWMEAVEPGLPLTFLDSHIQRGSALLGTTPELMAKGIPDAAFEPIEGDDKKVASALKKRNKAEAHGQTGFDFSGADATKLEADTVARAVAALEAASDATSDALARKESQWADVLGSAEYRHQKLVADAWCAAFVWPKQMGETSDAAPTVGRWRQLRDDPARSAPALRETAHGLADEYRFFHWHLQFPLVFGRGGFDVVLGNPPWERVKLQEQEFFASRNEEIAEAANAAARKKLIAALPEEDPQLWSAWCAASRRAEGESHVIRRSGRYPLCGKGDVNTYAIFAEHNRAVLGARGRAGFIVPPGLATDDTTKAYFQSLVATNGLVALYEFENEEFIFPGIDHRVRFILITVARARPTDVDADIAFANRNVVALRDRSRHFTLQPQDFETLNPNTRTCPTFRSRRDAEINLAIYRRVGVLWRESAEASGNAWGLRFMAMLHMANDSDLFRTKPELEAAGLAMNGNVFVNGDDRFLPLMEAKMVHHYDHRFGTYEGQTASQENQGKLPELDDAMHAAPDRITYPYYWVAEPEVTSRLQDRWNRGWLLGWRDICRSTDQRTVIASLVPRTAIGHKFPVMLPAADPQAASFLYGNLCSFVLDYAARQKVGGTSLTYFLLKQFPVLGGEVYRRQASWSTGRDVGSWLLPRILELSYTAWDLEPFARDVGYDGPPFRWDAGRRFLLRCELDAAFFHLYGLSREDTDYVMDTFPIVRKHDEKAHSEYRTKRVILEIYDAMAEATRTGVPYQTRLEPAPADTRMAHPLRVDARGSLLPLRDVAPETTPVRMVAAVATTVPNLSDVGANDWAGPGNMGSGEIQATVVAVLRANGAPMDRRLARISAVLCLEPHLLSHQLDEAERGHWCRVIGAAAKRPIDSLADETIAQWGAAVSGLRARGRLVEDLARNTWALGSGAEVIETGGWPDGRAGFIVHVMRRARESEVEAMVQALPASIRELLEHAA